MLIAREIVRERAAIALGPVGVTVIVTVCSPLAVAATVVMVCGNGCAVIVRVVVPFASDAAGSAVIRETSVDSAAAR